LIHAAQHEKKYGTRSGENTSMRRIMEYNIGPKLKGENMRGAIQRVMTDDPYLYHDQTPTQVYNQYQTYSGKIHLPQKFK
jgi:hypothetical protein